MRVGSRAVGYSRLVVYDFIDVENNCAQVQSAASNKSTVH